MDKVSILERQRESPLCPLHASVGWIAVPAHSQIFIVVDSGIAVTNDPCFKLRNLLSSVVSSACWANEYSSGLRNLKATPILRLNDRAGFVQAHQSADYQ